GPSARLEVLGGGARRSDLAVIEREVAPVRPMDEREAAAAEPAGGGMYDADGSRGRTPRVHDRAARSQHLGAGRGGRVMLTRDGAAARGRGPRAGGEDQGQGARQ